MKICVMSPLAHTGNSVVTALVGDSLARTQMQQTTVTYTGDNRRICNYLGVSALEDKTRTISQIVKLLEAEAIAPEDIVDYSVTPAENLHIMDTVDKSITEQESEKLMLHVYEHVKTMFSLCDCSLSIDDDIAIKLMKPCEIIIVVIQPDIMSYEAFLEWKESKAYPTDDIEKSVLVIVNRYKEEIDALRNITKKLGLKHADVCKLHDNPYITKACNSGDLTALLPLIRSKDPRVVELNNDLKEITQYIMSKLGVKFTWDEGKKKNE